VNSILSVKKGLVSLPESSVFQSKILLFLVFYDLVLGSEEVLVSFLELSELLLSFWVCGNVRMDLLGQRDEG
jgi:hypothetical protein